MEYDRLDIPTKYRPGEEILNETDKFVPCYPIPKYIGRLRIQIGVENRVFDVITQDIDVSVYPINDRQIVPCFKLSIPTEYPMYSEFRDDLGSINVCYKDERGYYKELIVRKFILSDLVMRSN